MIKLILIPFLIKYQIILWLISINLNQNKMASSQELNVETLLLLLKEKAKELKNTEKKLKKLEEKYVEIHKQQKGLLTDHETFI